MPIDSFRFDSNQLSSPFIRRASTQTHLHSLTPEMAEVQARQNPTARGRGGGRGGRGGFGGRNTTARRANGDKTGATTDSAAFDDDSDIAQLRKLYGEKLGLIKELFEDWSDADILYALKETDGDVELTATRIAEGIYFFTGILASFDTFLAELTSLAYRHHFSMGRSVQDEEACCTSQGQDRCPLDRCD